MILADLICAAIVALGMPNADVACNNMDVLVEAAEINEIDPVILTSVIYVESRWNPTVVSRDGACGLTQVLPRYSAGTRGRFGKRLTCKQLKNPETSIKRGSQILSWWLRNYGKGRYTLALCGYNAGFRCKGPNKSKGHRYAQKVLRISKKLKRQMEIEEREELENDEYIPGCYE